MKLTLSFFVALSLLGAGFAQKAKSAPVLTVKCAVMHDDVKLADALKTHHFIDYNKKRYYFCCPSCQASFKKNPAKYAKTAKSYPIPVTPKPKKSKA